MKLRNILDRIFSNEYRWYEVLFHVFFIGLILVSAIQYLERTLPFDSAYYCFKILQARSFNIESNRWGAIYNQFLPYAGMRLGCSLDTFLMLYSISFALCNYVFFLVIFYRFKQLYTALAFVLVQVVVYRYNFYCPASEIHATTGPAFLMFAFLVSGDFLERKKVVASLVILLLIFWMANTHLVSVCIVLFMFGYAFVSNKALLKNYYLCGALIIGAGIFVFLVKNIGAGSYQDEKMINWDSIKFVFTRLNEVEGFKYLKSEFKNNYYVPSAIFLVVIIYYLLKRNFLKLLVTLGALGCFFVLDMAYNISYTSSFVLSNYYSVFGFFILIPFSVDVIKNINFKIGYLSIVLILAVSVFKILKCGIVFTEQINYFKRVTENLRGYKESKFIVCESNMDWDKILMDWDIPFQSLIISSLHDPDSAITFYTPDDMEAWGDISFKDTTSFLGPYFSPFGTHKHFPKEYFNLRYGVYKKVTSFQDSSFIPSDFNKQNLTLNFDKDKYILFQRPFRTIEVTVNNLSDNNYPAILTQLNQLYIGYKIIEEKTGKEVLDGRSLIELDVPPHQSIRSGIKLDLRVLKKGNYLIDADFVSRDYKPAERQWLGSNKRVSLKIL